MKMQELLDSARHLFGEIPVAVKAAILTAVLVLLRHAYDGKGGKWGRKCIEAALCMATTWGVSFGLSAVGLGEDSSWLVAVAIGWLGADWVRDHAKRWTEKKLGNDERGI